MPRNKEAFIRYRIIDKCLRNRQHKFPSLDYIVGKCEDTLGTEFSVSTIQKDIYAMRFDEALAYNAPIKYSKIHKGYCYEDENYTIASVSLNSDEIEALEFAAAILDQFKGVGILEKYDHAIDKIFDAVQLRRVADEVELDEMIQIEKPHYFQGSELLSVLVELVKARSPVEFEYRAFDNDEEKTRLVHPYLLKEYRNRWYLVGLDESSNKIQTFGFDRIRSLRKGNLKFRHFPSFDPKLYFKHSFGITSFLGKPEKVVLRFNALQGKYVKTQPLHPTQKIVNDEANELVVELKVGITIELVMQILSYGQQVEVIEPTSLRNEIKNKLQQTLNQY